MEEAARQLAAWKQTDLPPLRVAINVSSLQLGQSGCARQITQVLNKHQLSAGDLYAESTETAVLQGREQVLENLYACVHSLGMQVVAKRIEDHDHLAFLIAEGCDLLQGYLFNTPRPASEIERLLNQSLPEAI